MNTAEKTEYLNSLTKYMEEHKVYAIFEDLYKGLAISQPSDPMKFLVERLKSNRRCLMRKTYFRHRSARSWYQGNHIEAQSALWLDHDFGRRLAEEGSGEENRAGLANRAVHFWVPLCSWLSRRWNSFQVHAKPWNHQSYFHRRVPKDNVPGEVYGQQGTCSRRHHLSKLSRRSLPAESKVIS